MLARRLLELNGVEEASVELLGLTPEQGAEALLRGDVDGVVLLMPWQSPVARHANRLKVPLGYAQRLFILKSHIALAQQRVDKRRHVSGHE